METQQVPAELNEIATRIVQTAQYLIPILLPQGLPLGNAPPLVRKLLPRDWQTQLELQIAEAILVMPDKSRWRTPAEVEAIWGEIIAGGRWITEAISLHGAGIDPPTLPANPSQEAPSDDGHAREPV